MRSCEQFCVDGLTRRCLPLAGTGEAYVAEARQVACGFSAVENTCVEVFLRLLYILVRNDHV